MAPKLFITGSTGYIGGDAFYAIATAHPAYEISVLVRSEDKASLIAAKFPSIRFVYGGLDDLDILEREAEAADVVLNTADADHPSSARALISGLSKRSPPGTFIHTSGTGLLCHPDWTSGIVATKLSSKVYSDISSISEIKSFPSGAPPVGAPHRDVDEIVFAADKVGVKSAIVTPPTIYGPSRGPATSKPNGQVYDLAKATLQRKKGFMINDGLAYWSNVHISDLSNLYLSLVESAISPPPTAPPFPIFGPEAYYFAEHGEHIWGDISLLVAQEAKKQGFIDTEAVDKITPEEADTMAKWGGFLWSFNSRSKAERARKVFNWTPKGTSFVDEIPAAVRGEAERLGLVKHHASVAAGDA